MRPERVRKSLREGGRLAKRPPIVQQRGQSFPGLCGVSGIAKTRRIPRAPRIYPDPARGPPEPLAVAPVRSAVAVETVEGRPAVAVHHAVAPAAKAAVHAGQDAKPALLPLIEGLVERVRRIGDLLHLGCRGRHRIRVPPHPLPPHPPPPPSPPLLP